MVDNKQIFGCSQSVILHGKMLLSGNFRLDCGYDIPQEQIEYLIRMLGALPLKAGDQASFMISQLKTACHVHVFKCECGEARTV